MRRAIIAVVLVGFACAGLSGGHTQAKGGAVGVEPDSGELGTAIELWSTDWVPDSDVRLYAAFSTNQDDGYSGPAQFVGPIATVRSDENGDWRAALSTDEIPNLPPPTEPGYLFFRADSDGLPLYLENGNVTDFVVEQDGRRPAGSGEIRLSISLASGASVPAAVFGWRRAGSPWFFSPYSVIPVPFDVTLPSLGDGDWEIVAMTGAGSEPIGEGTYDLGTASLCFNPSCASDTPIVDVHRARRVTISDAQVVDVELQLGQDGDPNVQPPPVPAEGSDSWDTAGLIAGATLLLALLTVASYFAGRRRL